MARKHNWSLDKERLVPQRKLFAEVYARQPRGNKDAQLAAKIAGYASHNKDTLRTTACRLLRIPEVRQRILELDPTLEEFKHTEGINAEWVLFELATLWDTDPIELFDEEGELKKIRDMSPEARKLIQSFEVGANGSIKVKLIDRMKVLEDIGKHRDVTAFQSAGDSEVDKSLARLLNAAAKTVESSAADRAIDVSPNKEKRDGSR